MKGHFEKSGYQLSKRKLGDEIMVARIYSTRSNDTKHQLQPDDNRQKNTRKQGQFGHQIKDLFIWAGKVSYNGCNKKLLRHYSEQNGHQQAQLIAPVSFYT